MSCALVTKSALFNFCTDFTHRPTVAVPLNFFDVIFSFLPSLAGLPGMVVIEKYRLDKFHAIMIELLVLFLVENIVKSTFTG